MISAGKTRKEAEKNLEKLRGILQGKGWKFRIVEPPFGGFDIEAHNGYISLNGIFGVEYWTLMCFEEKLIGCGDPQLSLKSSKGEGHPQMFKNPNAAVDAQFKKANEVLAAFQQHMKKQEELLAA